jgi:sugar phosphate permease
MSSDPVRARRERIARAAAVGQRAGYGLFLMAIVLFAVALATGFPAALAVAVIACLAVGSLVLAPSIVAGFAARAAEREDRERGL